MYLQQQISSEELAGKISDLRQAMVKGGMAFDRKGYALLLEASVHMADTQVVCNFFFTFAAASVRRIN